MSEPSLSAGVVICTFSERRLPVLLAAIQSVKSQTRRPDELVLVVDHNDDLRRRLRGQLGEMTVIANEGEQGLSAGRNTGVGHLSTDIVAFLDDDAVPARDWLEWLLEPYRRVDVVAVGGAVVPAWETGQPDWFPSEYGWVVGCTYRGMETDSRRLRNVIGANMSFRREVLHQAGGFGTGFGRVGDNVCGCEETELCLRIKHLCEGAEILYEPHALVRHSVPDSRASWSYFCRRCFGEGRNKALLETATGSGALAPESSYALRVLPTAAARGIAEGFAGDASGFRRALAVAAGLGLTTAGFVSGLTRRRSMRRSLSA